MFEKYSCNEWNFYLLLIFDDFGFNFFFVCFGYFFVKWEIGVVINTEGWCDDYTRRIRVNLLFDCCKFLESSIKVKSLINLGRRIFF